MSSASPARLAQATSVHPAPARFAPASSAPPPARVTRPNGAVLIAGPPREEQVTGAVIAVPLAGLALATVLAAPIAVAARARSIAAAARADGADVLVEPVVTADFAGVTVEALAGVPAALPAWYAAAALAPSDRLAPDRLEQLRRAALARAVSDERWSDDVRRALFGSDHRYGAGQAERTAYLRTCEPTAVLAAMAELARVPPVLAASSADPARVDALALRLDEATYARGRPGPPEAVAGPVEPRPLGSRVVVPHPGERAYYLLGTAGVRLGSAEKFPLHVAWAVLGGREGVLDRRLRLKAAVTYSLAAFSRDFAEGGYGLCFAGCDPDALDVVAAEVRNGLEWVAAGRVPAAEHRSARERLIIQQHLAAQTGRGLALQLCGYETAGLDPADVGAYPARIAEVTAADVAAVATRYLSVPASMEIRMDPRAAARGSGRGER